MAANRAALKKVPRSASSSRKNPVAPRGKVNSLRLPPGKILKAEAMLIEGHSQREIGRKLHMSAHTVAKIVRTEDFAQHQKNMRERVFAIAPDAIESFRKQVATDGKLAYAFLKDIQIIPSPQAIAEFMAAATPAESGYERQKRMLVDVLLSSRETYGTPLPPEMEKVMAKDAESEEPKTPEAKSPRR